MKFLTQPFIKLGLANSYIRGLHEHIENQDAEIKRLQQLPGYEEGLEIAAKVAYRFSEEDSEGNIIQIGQITEAILALKED